MLRFTHALLLFVAMVALVAAGPTVRKDETANAITTVAVPPAPETKPPASEEPVSGENIQTPAKLPISNDEPANDATSTAASETKPTDSESTTSVPTTSASTTAASDSSTVSTTSSATTKAPSTAAVSGEPTVPTTKPPRKVITFDQRQEGKYNIRADLENFVIVVVPSGSSSGASLLDLLTRSAHKKDAHQTRKASHKRKNNKAHGAHRKIAQVTPEVIVLDENSQRSAQLETEEFIEGRTPYKVDLSSSARSVDGDDAGPLGAPGRKASFAFSVEPASSSRLVRFPAASGNYPHPHGNGRALRVGGYPNTNTLLVAAGSSSATNNHILPGDGDNNPPRDGTNSLLLLRRSYDAAGHATEPDRDGIDGDNGLAVYSHHPPPPSSLDSLEYEPVRSDVDMTQLQLQPDSEYRYDDLEQNDEADTLDGDWDELRLLGAQEQCGPDRRRDSYGVCQFVQP
uniref:Secreted protein n=1 Tax=Anopheles stephensi TaxID=30069 RepID=A0A182Y935_ANOST